MAQISGELGGAGAASGANGLQTFLRIYLPLLRPALMASFLYCAIIAFKELTATLLLFTSGSQVLSVSMYSLWINGDYTEVCALGTFMLAILVVAVLGVRWISGRAGLNLRAASGVPSAPVSPADLAGSSV
jgi:iron(III) transport system permease protein